MSSSWPGVQRSADDVAIDNFRVGMLRGRIEQVLEVWHAGRNTPGADRIIQRQGRLVGLLADGREIADCARELGVERATVYADIRVLADVLEPHRASRLNTLLE